MHVPSISFEIFPPRSISASFRLWESLAKLQPFDPRFVSVTYGAQGGTQDETLDCAKAVHTQTGIPVAAHITAARASVSDVMARAETYAEAGIRDLVVLRGDGDTPGAAFVPHPKGFESSVALIKALSDLKCFNIRVGCYPESHPDAASPKQNIDYLKAKFDAGAHEAISQFFFEPETFLRFRDACVSAGIDAPLIPGILPITNWAKARRFAQTCGTEVPAWLDAAFSKAARDTRTELLALAHSTEMCARLAEEGVAHHHIYTMNSATLTQKLVTALGVPTKRPEVLRDVA